MVLTRKKRARRRSSWRGGRHLARRTRASSASRRRRPAGVPRAPRVTFYFDLSSPFTYLAAERVDRQFAAVTWRPVLEEVLQLVAAVARARRGARARARAAARLARARAGRRVAPGDARRVARRRARPRGGVRARRDAGWRSAAASSSTTRRCSPRPPPPRTSGLEDCLQRRRRRRRATARWRTRARRLLAQRRRPPARGARRARAVRRRGPHRRGGRGGAGAVRARRLARRARTIRACPARLLRFAYRRLGPHYPRGGARLPARRSLPRRARRRRAAAPLPGHVAPRTCVKIVRRGRRARPASRTSSPRRYAFRLIAPASPWLNGRRTPETAVAAWRALAGLPRDFLARGRWAVALNVVPISLFVTWELDLVWYAFLIVAAGAAVVPVLRRAPALLRDGAAHAPGARGRLVRPAATSADLGGVRVPLRWKLLLALPAINVVTGVVVVGPVGRRPTTRTSPTSAGTCSSRSPSRSRSRSS